MTPPLDRPTDPNETPLSPDEFHATIGATETELNRAMLEESAIDPEAELAFLRGEGPNPLAG